MMQEGQAAGANCEHHYEEKCVGCCRRVEECRGKCPWGCWGCFCFPVFFLCLHLHKWRWGAGKERRHCLGSLLCAVGQACLPLWVLLNRSAGPQGSPKACQL